MPDTHPSSDVLDVRTDLNALAVRCEQATGPDRELDIRICTDALGKSRLDEGFQVAPHYTASVDAALTLVPEGFTKWIYDADDGRCICRLEREYDKDKCANAATWPLAITAAALRAQAARLNEQENRP